MIKAKYHVQKVEVSDLTKENWTEFLDVPDVAAVSFSSHGKFIAVASASPGVERTTSRNIEQTHISLWDARAVIYPMMELKTAGLLLGSNFICHKLFWSFDSKYVGVIFHRAFTGLNNASTSCNGNSSSDENTDCSLLVVYCVLSGEAVSQIRYVMHSTLSVLCVMALYNFVHGSYFCY